jgi:sortase A
MRGAGAGIIAFMIIGFFFTFGPVIQEEVNYNLGRRTYEINIEPAIVGVVEAEKIVSAEDEARTYGVESDFSVVIPKIGASSKVIANVDASKKEEYIEALKHGVAHAKGTFFPGQGKNVFLFAHSTDSPINVARYNAVFYLLRKLEQGDNIIIFFSDRKYEYEVEKKFIADPEDISWLTDETGSEKLILLTCDPPGTTWKRLLIIARPVPAS